MNMIPDETRLALWMDDELSGDELAEMDAWAASQPEHLAAREELRNYRNTMAAALPASEEPPYPDFFLSRVNQGIRDLKAAEAPPSRGRDAVPFWKSWFMPAAACAGMILAFGFGRNSAEPDEVVKWKPSPVNLTPVVYTPEEGVEAQWFASNKASATVIVLEGVSAIPDSVDFSQTVYVPTISDADRTATREGREFERSTQ
ncbi:MAG: hypothetical protein NWT08_11535 [Akkermansiaceae bacterium]|nr:hypothetical protein [Akkermansiaceae bacterium]